MNLRVKEQIKSLVAQKGITFIKLTEILTEHTGKKYSPDGLSHKLSRGTLTYNEAATICDVLGFDITFTQTNAEM